MSFPLYPAAPPDFFRARPVANRTLSISDATVSTPPTIAHVLLGMVACKNSALSLKKQLKELTMSGNEQTIGASQSVRPG